MLRHFATLGTLVIACSIPLAVMAQRYPSKPVRIIVPYPPGTFTDVLARTISERLSARLGQPVYVENRPGGGGMAAMEAVLREPPDGYTLALTIARSIQVAAMPAPKPDFVRDFETVSTVVRVPTVLVVAASEPYRSVSELIGSAKSRPGSLTYASFGVGSLPHLLAEQFKQGARIDLSHVPYQGSAAATMGLLGRQAQVMFLPWPNASEEVKKGRLRPLALVDVARSPLLPQLPTLREAGGPILEGSATYAILAPVKTPSQIVDRLEKEVSEVVREPQIRDRLLYLGAEPFSQPREKFRAEIRADQEKYSKTSFATARERSEGGFSQPAPEPPMPRASGSSASPAPLPRPAERSRSSASSESPSQGPPQSPPGVAPAAPAAEASAPIPPSSVGAGPSVPMETAAIPESLYWNSLAEPRGQPYRPVAVLAANTEYTVRFDLAALAYDPDERSIAAIPGSRGIRKLLARLEATGKPSERLSAVVMLDSAVFTGSLIARYDFDVRLDRLRNFAKGATTIPASPMPLLRASNDREFVFGVLAIDLQTREVLPKDLGAVAVSLWHEGIPVDEVSVGFCTAASGCDGARAVNYGLGGIDSARTAVIGTRALPSAALHVIEFGPNKVVGVFLDHTADKREYVRWDLDNSPNELERQIDNLTASLAKATPQSMKNESIGLFRTLFPPHVPTAVGAAGRFRDYFNRVSAQRQTGAAKLPPSLFVRAQFSTKTPPTLLPLGVTAIPLDPKNESWEILGHNVRVESPLRLQSYGGSAECIKNWHVVGPPADNEEAFLQAVGRLSGRLKALPKNQRGFEIGGKLFPITDNMSDFFNWASTGEMEQPTVLSILSHHDRDNVRFASNPSVPAKSLGRSFLTQPTIAILNGCSTASQGAGATGFIRVLNELGVQAVIATVTEVPGAMAGDFLECFARQAETAPAGGRPLSEAFSNALGCLEVDKGHGPKAYWYTLLGDGGLRLCRPN